MRLGDLHNDNAAVAGQASLAGGSLLGNLAESLGVGHDELVVPDPDEPVALERVECERYRLSPRSDDVGQLAVAQVGPDTVRRRSPVNRRSRSRKVSTR